MIITKTMQGQGLYHFFSPSFAYGLYIADLRNVVEVMLLGFSYNLLLFQA